MKYRERLFVPASWWLIGLFFSVSFVTAVGFYLGPIVAVVGGLATVLAVAVALLSYGHLSVEVGPSGLSAGDAWLDWEHAGKVRVLDESGTRARLGVAADRHGYLVTRPYVRSAVEIEVVDAADPHPYWLVSSRHPAHLAAAVESVRSPSREPGPPSVQT